jgi:hypothetical protein
MCKKQEFVATAVVNIDRRVPSLLNAHLLLSSWFLEIKVTPDMGRKFFVVAVVVVIVVAGLLL